ncbi:hypothetical protein MOK15_09385 [Sphingobium sp. BYY-5]|uniref:hypothetical protein n=1 Tax=Sphingobium sp. BYY-5 TaxID=2926400 RepID=UPI001FA7BDF5|nr:hypothetical protein [Sphingobium sp. BYY-5]MCI4590308.1 hypothetical protein [Sphingobium sp. BYY-5]
MRIFPALIAAVALVATPAMAAPCRDAHGKFIKCATTKTAMVKKAPCKDAKGKFIKCAK